MSAQKRYRPIFWVYVALMVPALLIFFHHLVSFALGHTQFPADSPLDYGVRLLIALVISPTTVVIGMWCLRRAPGNLVGAILVLWGVGVIDLIRLDPLPLPAGFSSLFAPVRWTALFSLIVYFPDGNVVPRRFERWVDSILFAAIIAGIVAGLGEQWAPGRDTLNIFYIPLLAPFADILATINSLLVLIVACLFGFSSQIIRFRRADFQQRQQMKWLLVFFVPIFVFLPLQVIIDVLAPPYSGAMSAISGSTILAWFMAFPVIAVGNAILRHRLYDIDIIIRRTLVYSILTTILAAIYFGGVILVQQVLKPLTESSDLAIVASTLLIAALFTPVRRRVQNTIDQRFYRRKYDAQKTLEAFGATLRDEVDIETLKTHLVGVVQETMQPTHMALWITGSPQKEKTR